MLIYTKLLFILFVVVLSGIQSQAQKRLPIIDMHLHASSLADFGGGGRVCTNDQKITFPGWDPQTPISLDKLFKCKTPIQSPLTDEAVMKESLAILEQYNIWAVANGSLAEVSAWQAASPQRIIPALNFASRTQTPAEFPTCDIRFRRS